MPQTNVENTRLPDWTVFRQTVVPSGTHGPLCAICHVEVDDASRHIRTCLPCRNKEDCANLTIFSRAHELLDPLTDEQYQELRLIRKAKILDLRRDSPEQRSRARFATHRASSPRAEKLSISYAGMNSAGKELLVCFFGVSLFAVGYYIKLFILPYLEDSSFWN